MSARTARSNRQANHDQGSWTVVSGSVEQTQALGERLGRLLRPGDVVALHGALGSGKTTLIQGIALGLGCDPSRVKSPTFVLMREYPGRLPLIHLDAYRLEGASAVAWLDLEWLCVPTKVSVIEWAERCEALLPADHLQLRIEHVSAHRRRLTATSTGPRNAQVVEQWRNAAGDVLAVQTAPADHDEIPRH